MDIERLVESNLKSAIKDARLSNNTIYTENELKPALLAFLNSLEGIIQEVCKPFNAFGLLCALEHYIPIHITKPRKGFEADAQILFNSVATLAFKFSSLTRDAVVKFTRAEYNKIAKTDDYSWLDNYSEAIQKIYYITSTIDLVIKNLRWLGKGATAKVIMTGNDIPTIINMQTPIELQKKMGEYDERLIANQDILMKQAIPLGVAKPETPLKSVVINPNWSEYRKGDLNPAPIPLIFGMDAIYAFTSFHSDEVIQVFKKRVHVEDLFVFMATLFKPLVEDTTNNVRFAGQGYSFAEEQHVIDYIANHAPTLYADCFSQKAFEEGTPFVFESLYPAYWQEVAPIILRFISHDFKSRESIDHLLIRPVKFAYRCDDDTVFLHLGSVIHFFMYFLDQFQNTGQFGEIKGKSFEILLLSLIESINGFKRIWEPSHKLMFPVANKMGTDIDVFVQRNELALLISCKSYGVNRKYELGDGQACWGRSEDAKSWFRFTHQTAKVLAEHHSELNLPKKIQGILPFVCTGWPEYLFEPSEDYFMKDGTPRIATMKEIEQFCRSIDDAKSNKLLSDPWCVRIPHD